MEMRNNCVPLISQPPTPQSLAKVFIRRQCPPSADLSCRRRFTAQNKALRKVNAIRFWLDNLLSPRKPRKAAMTQIQRDHGECPSPPLT